MGQINIMCLLIWCTEKNSQGPEPVLFISLSPAVPRGVAAPALWALCARHCPRCTGHISSHLIVTMTLGSERQEKDPRSHKQWDAEIDTNSISTLDWLPWALSKYWIQSSLQLQEVYGHRAVAPRTELHSPSFLLLYIRASNQRERKCWTQSLKAIVLALPITYR